jgi:hypothetical protein
MKRSGLAGLLWLGAFILPAQSAMAQGAASEYIVLDTAHPDWRDIVKSDAYASWAVSQPDWVKKIIIANGRQLVDGAGAAEVISRFKGEQAGRRPPASDASTSDWLRITSAEDGAVVYINGEGIKSSATPKAWVKFDYSKVKAVKHRETVELWKFDCLAETVVTLSSTSYSSSGSVLRSRKTVDYSFNYEPVVPDTIAARIMRTICSPRGD